MQYPFLLVYQMQLDKTLNSRTEFIPDQICFLLDICLITTYFSSPVHRRGEEESLSPYSGKAPGHWLRYLDDSEHISSGAIDIPFT